MARLLVVDDDREVLELFETALVDFGHEVTGALTSVRARQRLEAKRYEIAIVEYWLKEEDGLRLAEWIRAQGVPVLMMTGAIATEPLEKAGLPLMRKPFSMRALDAVVRMMLRGDPPRGIDSPRGGPHRRLSA